MESSHHKGIQQSDNNYMINNKVPIAAENNDQLPHDPDKEKKCMNSDVSRVGFLHVRPAVRHLKNIRQKMQISHVSLKNTLIIMGPNNINLGKFALQKSS